MPQAKFKLGAGRCCCCHDFLVVTPSDGSASPAGVRRLNLGGTYPSNSVSISAKPTAPSFFQLYVADYRNKKLITLESAGSLWNITQRDLDLSNPRVIGQREKTDVELLVAHNWAAQQLYYLKPQDIVTEDLGDGYAISVTQELRRMSYDGSSDALVVSETFRSHSGFPGGFAGNAVWVPGLQRIYYSTANLSLYGDPPADSNTFSKLKYVDAAGGAATTIVTYEGTSHGKEDNDFLWLGYSVKRGKLIWIRREGQPGTTLLSSFYVAEPDGSGESVILQYVVGNTPHQLFYFHVSEKEDRIFFEDRDLPAQRTYIKSMKFDATDMKVYTHTDQQGWKFPPVNYKPSNTGFARSAFGCRFENTGPAYNGAGTVF